MPKLRDVRLASPKHAVVEAAALGADFWLGSFYAPLLCRSIYEVGQGAMSTGTRLDLWWGRWVFGGIFSRTGLLHGQYFLAVDSLSVFK